MTRYFQCPATYEICMKDLCTICYSEENKTCDLVDTAQRLKDKLNAKIQLPELQSLNIQIDLLRKNISRNLVIAKNLDNRE